jgi:hypothetical protein
MQASAYSSPTKLKGSVKIHPVPRSVPARPVLNRSPPGRVFYFAFGANVNPVVLKRRNLIPKTSTTGTVHNFKLVFNHVGGTILAGTFSFVMVYSSPRGQFSSSNRSLGPGCCRSCFPLNSNSVNQPFFEGVPQLFAFHWWMEARAVFHAWEGAAFAPVQNVCTPTLFRCISMSPMSTRSHSWPLAGYGNIEYKPADISRPDVHGVVHDLSQSEFNALARMEGGYDVRTVHVACSDGETLQAQAFTSNWSVRLFQETAPTALYINKICAGAEVFGLSARYQVCY